MESPSLVTVMGACVQMHMHVFFSCSRALVKCCFIIFEVSCLLGKDGKKQKSMDG